MVNAVRKHGKNWPKITDEIGTRSYNCVLFHAKILKKKILLRQNIEDSDILPALLGKTEYRKTQK